MQCHWPVFVVYVPKVLFILPWLLALWSYEEGGDEVPTGWCMLLLHDCKLSAAPDNALHATSKTCAALWKSGWNCHKTRKETSMLFDKRGAYKKRKAWGWGTLGDPINVSTPAPVNAAVTTQADHAPLSNSTQIQILHDDTIADKPGKPNMHDTNNCDRMLLQQKSSMCLMMKASWGSSPERKCTRKTKNKRLRHVYSGIVYGGQMCETLPTRALRVQSTNAQKYEKQKTTPLIQWRCIWGTSVWNTAPPGPEGPQHNNNDNNNNNNNNKRVRSQQASGPEHKCTM